MEPRVFERTWIQGKSPEIDDLKDYSFQGESAADTFIIDGKTAEGSAVDITGSIIGVYLGENNNMVPLVGTVSEGKATITLEDTCYKIPGRFILTIYAINETQTICIYTGIGHMFRTQSKRLAYPSMAVPDIQELIEEAKGLTETLEAERIAVIAGIEAKGEEVIASIPQDYTALSENVAELNGVVVLATVAETKAYLGIT